MSIRKIRILWDDLFDRLAQTKNNAFKLPDIWGSVLIVITGGASFANALQNINLLGVPGNILPLLLIIFGLYWCIHTISSKSEELTNSLIVSPVNTTNSLFFYDYNQSARVIAKCGLILSLILIPKIITNIYKDLRSKTPKIEQIILAWKEEETRGNEHVPENINVRNRKFTLTINNIDEKDVLVTYLVIEASNPYKVGPSCFYNPLTFFIKDSLIITSRENSSIRVMGSYREKSFEDGYNVKIEGDIHVDPCYDSAHLSLKAPVAFILPAKSRSIISIVLPSRFNITDSRSIFKDEKPNLRNYNEANIYENFYFKLVTKEEKTIEGGINDR